MKPLHLIGVKTPKEKADELIKDFSQYSAVRILDLNEYDIQRKANATQCAILCVEEIIKVTTRLTGEELRYWQNVKTELLKQTL